MSQENNFIPEQGDYKPLSPFKLFVKSNFPFIEDTFEALDNYGLYCKIVEYLNNVISNENVVESNVTALYNAFVSLNTYVSNYFDNLDVQEEINNKLDDMASSGELQEIIDDIFNDLQSQINRIASGAPLAASSTAGMTDTTKIYVNTTDGYWYYYNGSNWVQGGVYQSTVISSDDVQIDGRNVKSNKLPYNYGYNEFRKFTNFIRSAVSGGIGNEPNIYGSTTRICNDPDHFLGSGVYELINLNTTNFSYFWFIVNNETGLITNQSANWVTTENLTLTINDGYSLLLCIRKNDNSTITVTEGLENIRMKIGNINMMSLPQIYTIDPIEINSITNKITIKSGTYIIIKNKKITIDADLEISMPLANALYLLVLNTTNNQITLQNITSGTTLENKVILGYIYLYSAVVEKVILNSDYKINGLPTPNTKYFLNNNLMYRIENINPTSGGIAHRSTSKTRVSLWDYINFDGEIIIHSKKPTQYRYAIQKYSLSDGVYTRVGDTRLA